MQAERHTDIHTDRQIDKHIGIQAVIWTYRQADRQIQTRYTDSKIETGNERSRETIRKRTTKQDQSI